MSNRLIHETSPYLRQHAHNPVDWYPWGDEALARARAENKPILVSIGYSACHWCHVMERESFEDAAVAAFMNEHFVNIKIDREERPDLDHIYMDAVQAMTGSGGWPLNVFLTPDKKPFYGGTYFPPRRIYNRPSWMDVLTGVAGAFAEKYEEIEQQAKNLTDYLNNANSIGGGSAAGRADKDQLDIITANLLRQADRKSGGFGSAPKFPQTFSILYLLRYAALSGDREAEKQAVFSLDCMQRGGIYDQIGGGFARYSVDNEWLVPHFEKMLYDNALLVSALSEAYLSTGITSFEKTIRATIRFLNREMKDPNGGYYAALDADSEGVEGKFYVWTYEEFVNVAGEDGALMARYFGVTPEGNWEHTNILHIPLSGPEFASEIGIGSEELEEKIRRVSEKLMHHRDHRVRPGLDDKILLGWNGLMLSALCHAAAALGDDDLLNQAEELARFLSRTFLKNDATAFHSCQNGKPRFPAFLDDYASWIEGLIGLYECSGKVEWIDLAEKLTETVIRLFSDEEGLFFFYTAAGQDDVIIRKKEMYDGAQPSGNALMCTNLKKLGFILGKPAWEERAEAMLNAYQSTVVRYPSSFGVWASGLLGQVYGYKEVVVRGEGYERLRKELLKVYVPLRILCSGPDPEGKIPILEGKPEQGETKIYVCENYACRAPVNTVSAYSQLVRNQ